MMIVLFWKLGNAATKQALQVEGGQESQPVRRKGSAP